MKRYKIVRLINPKYYVFVFLFFFSLNIISAESQYILDLVSSTDLKSARVQDLKQLVKNRINQKKLKINEQDRQFILKNMPLFKIIDKSNNFPSDNSVFVSGNQYFFTLGLNQMHDNKHLIPKYTFSFKYKNRLDELLIKNNLGEISDLSEKEIIHQVKRLNPALNPINLQFQGQPSSTGVFLSSDKHTDTVFINYQIKQKPISSLNDLVRIKNLGEISDLSEKEIIHQVKRLNPALNPINLQFQGQPSSTGVFLSSDKHTDTVFINYQIKQKPISSLNDLVRIKNLGEISDLSEKEIIHQVKRLNPALNPINLQFQGQPSSTGVFLSSDKHTDTVFINYQIKQKPISSLNDLVRIKNLGEISDLSEKEIIHQVKRLNPALNPINLQFQGQPSSTGVFLSSDKHTDTVFINYQIKQKPISSLNDLVRIKNLGEISDLSEKEIIHQVKRLNPALNPINLQFQGQPSSTGVFLSSDKHTDTVFINYQIKQKPISSLNDLVRIKNLGEISDLSEKEIIHQVKRLNPALNPINLQFQGQPSSTGVFLSSDKHTDTVFINYQIKQKPISSLNDLVRIKNLGEISDLSEKEIIHQVKRLNPALNPINLQFQGQPSSTGVFLSSDKHTDTVFINYQIKQKPISSLNDLVRIKNLGEISDLSEKEIIHQVKRLNPALNPINLQFQGQPSSTGVFLSSDKHTDTVFINYQIKQKPISSLNDLVRIKNLGEISDLSEKEIIHQVKRLNPALNPINLQFQGQPSSTGVFLSSDKHTDTVFINYQIKQKPISSLNDLVRIKNLGEISDLSEKEIIHQVKRLNPALNPINLQFQGQPSSTGVFLSSDKHTDTVFINYQIKQKPISSLNDLVRIKNLGEISDLSEKEIIHQVKRLNPALNPINLQFQGQPSSTGVFLSSDKHTDTVFINYQIKQKPISSLNDLVRIKNLGEISDLSEKEIIHQVKRLNPALNPINLQFQGQPSSTGVFLSSDKHTDTVFINYQIKQKPISSLNDLVRIKNLGEISDLSEKEIIHQVKRLNPALNPINLQFQGQPSSTGVFLSSDKHTDTVFINYQIKQKPISSLNDLVRIKNLGEISDLSEKEIIHQVKRLNPALNPINLQFQGQPSSTGVFLSSDKHTDTVFINYQIKQKPISSLNDLVRIKNLGEISDLSEKEIIHQVKRLNPALNPINLQFQGQPSSTGVFLSSDKHTDTVFINYQIKQKPISSLNDLVRIKNLGEISDLSEKEIIHQVKRLNPALNPINLQFQGQPSSTGVFLSSDKHTDTVFINYQIKQKPISSLNDLVRIKNLGEISDLSEKEIIHQVKRLNPALNPINLQFQGQPSSTGVFLSSDKHTDTVFINYQIKQKPISSLNDLVRIKNLGEISDLSEKEIIHQVKRLNPALNPINLQFQGQPSSTGVFLSSDKHTDTVFIEYLNINKKQNQYNFFYSNLVINIILIFLFILLIFCFIF
ncbi:hypothetical protein [Candidatus Phytoplasma fraxini]|uniref:Uncharacterized protein n=1 Tax=Ash yellows phytoplasma TaxID=35780 RepID=A0ABZ2U880_ASHYP